MKLPLTIKDLGGGLICAVDDDKQWVFFFGIMCQDHALIVRAVNAHHLLLRVLEAARQLEAAAGRAFVRPTFERFEDQGRALEAMAAAIAAAEEELARKE